MTTMTIAILLYIALSLLAMIIIFGACLVAARADSATDAKKVGLLLERNPTQCVQWNNLRKKWVMLYDCK